MKFIVGLGNPGAEYSLTRHNVGFMAVDELARHWNVENWRSRDEALVAEYRGAESILLIKPQTFMNLSGTAVAALARWYKVAAADIIAIFDDMDLPLGKLRVRTQGGSGGHRGVESLLVHLGEASFPRVRIGIGRPPDGWDVVKFVLSRFDPAQVQLTADAVKQAALAAECIAAHGIHTAMNHFNH